MATLTTHQNPYELEAVLAHEVAHVMTGNVMRRPRLIDAKRTVFLVIAISMAGIFAGLGLMADVGNVWSRLLLYALAVALDLLALFSLRRLDRFYRYDDILADSVAAKVTGGAEYLLKSIQETDLAYEYMRQKSSCPDTGAACRHFLVPPSPAQSSSASSLFKGGSVWGNSWWAKKAMESAEGMTAQRLENLRAIQQGRWPAFAGA